MPPKLLLEKVGLRYGLQPLFEGVTVSMQGGEAWAITGPNGSGKSSLLAIVAGYLHPSHGRVVREGSKLSWQSPHVQPPPDLLVSDILRDWRRYKEMSLSKDFAVQWALPEHKPFYTLSSGMRQRLLTGLALSLTQGIVLLDEPTAFLDEPHRRHIHGLLRQRIGEPQLLILCATNDPEEASLFPKCLHLPSYAPDRRV
ncbi:MAG: ABC transporter ATP-binding protein [Bacteroidia bacterium]|nr:ABC transporter ATP-binding protein [Bacteroidia bacterium]